LCLAGVDHAIFRAADKLNLLSANGGHMTYTKLILSGPDQEEKKKKLISEKISLYAALKPGGNLGAPLPPPKVFAY
jgi:hypothetical protein